MIAIQIITCLTSAFIIGRYWLVYRHKLRESLHIVSVMLVVAYAAASTFTCDVDTLAAGVTVAGVVASLVHDSGDQMPSNQTGATLWLTSGYQYPRTTMSSCLLAAGFLYNRSTCVTASLVITLVLLGFSVVDAVKAIFFSDLYAQTRAGDIKSGL